MGHYLNAEEEIVVMRERMVLLSDNHLRGGDIVQVYVPGRRKWRWGKVVEIRATDAKIMMDTGTEAEIARIGVDTLSASGFLLGDRTGPEAEFVRAMGFDSIKLHGPGRMFARLWSREEPPAGWGVLLHENPVKTPPPTPPTREMRPLVDFDD